MTEPTPEEIAADIRRRCQFMALSTESFVADAIRAERERLEDMLVKLYVSDPAYVAVARLCDEEIDKSGAMLGRVREKAIALRARTTELSEKK